MFVHSTSLSVDGFSYSQIYLLQRVGDSQQEYNPIFRGEINNKKGDSAAIKDLEL